MSKTHLNLQPTEQVVVQAAAQIYSAYIAAGRVQIVDEESWMERAIREAIRIAKTTDAVIITADEVE